MPGVRPTNRASGRSFHRVGRDFAENPFVRVRARVPPEHARPVTSRRLPIPLDAAAIDRIVEDVLAEA